MRLVCGVIALVHTWLTKEAAHVQKLLWLEGAQCFGLRVFLEERWGRFMPRCPTGASSMRDCVREREGQGKRGQQRTGCKACFLPLGMLELFCSEALSKKKKKRTSTDQLSSPIFLDPSAG